MNLSNEQLASLVSQRNVDQKRLATAVEFAKSANVPLSAALVEKGVLSDEQLGVIVASSYKIPFVELSKISIPEDVFHIVPEKVARKQKAIAFARDSTGVKIAMSDPTNHSIIDMVTKKTGQQAGIHYATERDIENTLQVKRSSKRRSMNFSRKILRKQQRRSTTICRLRKLSMS